MDFKTQNAILCEAEKMTDEFIQIVVKITLTGKMYAVAFMDGYGQPIDYLTDWHSNPIQLLDSLKAQNEYKTEHNRLFAGIPENPGEAELITSNID